MFGSEVLDVAIGLVFIYCLLSLVCTLVNEWIAGVLKLRAKTLEDGIASLLRDETRLEKFYDHPLIKSLGAYASPGKPDKKTAESAGPADKAEAAQPVQPTRRPRPSYISSATFATVLLEVIARPTSGDTSTKTFSDVRTAVAALPDHLRSALLPLLDEAESKLDVARENIERWFDSSMERVSGWYKRRLQLITLGVAVALTLAVNADTISIARTLYVDLPMRSSLVAMAEQAAKQPTAGGAQPGISYASDPANRGQDPAGGAAENPGAGGADPGGAAQNPAGGEKNPAGPALNPIVELASLQKKGLPLGWRGNSPDEPPTLHDIIASLRQPSRIPGLLLTALAISLGAPVWFDLLQKLVNLRAAGKAPAAGTSGEPAPSGKAKQQNGQ